MNQHIPQRRRGLLLGLGASSALAACAPPFTPEPAPVAAAAPPAGPHNVPFSSGSQAARTPAPPGATDCHFHIYDARFPAAPGAPLLPPDASVENYRALQRRIGTTRGVLVQPSTYGVDNTLHLESMNQLGRENFRMVAVVNDSVSTAELRRLNALGVRGIRFNLVQAGATTIDMLEPLSRRVAPMGWHVQLHMLGDQYAAHEALLLRLPSRIAIDHRGRLPNPAGVNHPGFRVITRLLDKGNTYVKLSGAYMDSQSGPPGYADSGVIAKALFAANPERMIWGSDWPHPTERLDNKPNDALLFDLLADWVANPVAFQRVLVQNPAGLYGFPAGA